MWEKSQSNRFLDPVAVYMSSIAHANESYNVIVLGGEFRRCDRQRIPPNSEKDFESENATPQKL
jgi:hypothetical protein